MPRALLGLAVGHTLAAWVMWLERYDDLAQAPLNPGHAAVGLLATWGILLLWLVPVTAATRFRLTPRASDQAPSSLLGIALRHLATALVLTVMVVVATRIGSDVGLIPAVFGSFWVLGFVCAGAALVFAHGLQPEAEWLDPRHPWPTAGQLVPAAAFGWSLFVLLELLFHHFSGAFVIFADMSAMLFVMHNEAIAMLFGPSGPWFLTCLVIYGGACAAVALISARMPPKAVPGRLLLGSGLAGLVGVISLAALAPAGRALVLHHVHPQVDDLALALISPPRPGPEAEAATRRLYPDAAITPRPAVGMTLAGYGALAQSHGPPPGRHDNVLVVFIDTISRRHLEAYGYGRAVAPNI